MLRSRWSKLSVLGSMVLLVAACETNQISHVKKPDGTIEIVDSLPETLSPGATPFLRAEGRELASICLAHSSDASKVEEALLARGWEKRKGLFGEYVSVKIPETLLNQRFSMSSKGACEFYSPNSWSRNVFEGAEARLIEQGFKQADQRTWVKGNITVELSGQVTTNSSSGTRSTVSILRK